MGLNCGQQLLFVDLQFSHNRAADIFICEICQLWSRGIRAAPLFPWKRLFCCLDATGWPRWAGATDERAFWLLEVPLLG